jgi:ABC-type nitrate/sulfonate/bicarbonate transport system ATPase subunit
MVTHDVEEAVRLADRIIVLGQGCPILDVRPYAPTPREPISHPHLIRQLLAALD